MEQQLQQHRIHFGEGDSMDTREYLNQIQRYDKIIKNQIEEINYLKTFATSISASTYGVERVQTSGCKDRIGDTITKLVDAQRKLADTSMDYMQKRQEIIDTISDVKDATLYDLLYKRYVECKKLSVIADEMEYNDEYVKHLHIKAIKYVKDMMNFES